MLSNKMVTVPEVTYNRAVIAAHYYRKILEMVLNDMEVYTTDKIEPTVIGGNSMDIPDFLRLIEPEMFKEREEALLKKYYKEKKEDKKNESF